MDLTPWRFRSPSVPSRTGSLCAAAALFVGLLSGCRDKSGPESGTSTTSSSAVTTDAQASAPKTESAADVTTSLKKELDAWAADQGAGNVTGYLARYDETTFKGTKRLREGAEKTYDFAAWKADRTKMLKNKPKVVADAPVFETWHDGKLPKGTAKATFIQRFKSGDYADHGKKVLTFVQTTGGTFKIPTKRCSRAARAGRTTQKTRSRSSMPRPGPPPSRQGSPTKPRARRRATPISLPRTI